MNRNSKKGFTIVELIIVIAVIAVLAAVLIPTFSNLIQKANVAADQTLIKNLNTALAMDTTVSKHETMTQALEATKANGFDVEKIVARATDNKIVWDSANDCFAYIEKGKSEPTYIPDTKTDASVADYQLWTIVDSTTLDTNFSSYIAGTNATGAVVATKGVDVGENTGITAVSYKNTGDKQDVVIRTNSASTNLTINAPLDTVTHYDEVGNVEIIDVDPNHSYHEHGTITGQLKIAKGHLVIESTASVPVVKVSATQSSDFSIESSYSGTLGVIVADDPAVLVVNGENKNITVTATTGVMGSESQNAEAYSAEKGFLNDWQSIFGEGGEITLLKDVTLTTRRTLANKINIKINLNKHTIAYTTSNQSRAFTVTDGAYLKLENGSLNFTLNSSSGAHASIAIESAASVELVDIDYQTDGAALFVIGDAATVIVKNSTIVAKVYAVGTNANNNSNYNVNINLINSTLKGCSPVLINVPGILNIDNCDIIGEMHGVIVRGGTATIKNSRITQDYKDTDSDNMYTYFDERNWGSGNMVQLGGLIIGNKSTAYQYPSTVTVENTIITINTPTTSKGYFPAIFTYGNSGTSLGVSLTTSGVTLQGGKMVVGNNCCIINGTDYRSSETSFPVTIE